MQSFAMTLICRYGVISIAFLALVSNTFGKTAPDADTMPAARTFVVPDIENANLLPIDLLAYLANNNVPYGQPVAQKMKTFREKPASFQLSPDDDRTIGQRLMALAMRAKKWSRFEPSIRFY